MSTSTATTTAFALPIRAADRLRLWWLRGLGPLAKPLVTKRELRVAVAGSFLMVTALVAATVLPLWTLAIGPIIWGTPHVLSDVRYLIVRPGHHRRWVLWIVVGLPLAAVSITSESFFGFLAAGGAILFARGPWWKKAVALPIALLGMWCSFRFTFMTAVFFAHAHNIVGVLLFWGWRRRGGRLHFVPLTLFVLACGLLLYGAFDPLVIFFGGLTSGPEGLDVIYHMRSLAHGVGGPLAARIVLVFTFAQSVHYIVWVRLIPEEDRARETPRTFRATLAALESDFGGPIMFLVFGVAVGIAVWAAFDVFAARISYLRAVLFHGYLELSAIGLLFVEGIGPRRATDRAAAR